PGVPEPDTRPPWMTSSRPIWAAGITCTAPPGRTATPLTREPTARLPATPRTLRPAAAHTATLPLAATTPHRTTPPMTAEPHAAPASRVLREVERIAAPAERQQQR